MSNQRPIRSAATSFILVLCIWTCIPPVSGLINQGNRPRDDTPATTTQSDLLSRGSSSSNSSIDEVAQDGKGMSPSFTLERLLHGQPIVRRQANDDFDHCTKDHLGSTFMEPPGCTYSGESFRLCVVGKRKMDRCVADRNDYCTFCTPGESYMMENNNCTECIPCKTCDPLTEQVKTDCNIIDNTVCVPKPPDPSCPPCPVTQVVVTSEDTSNVATDSTSQIGSTQPYSTAIETSPVIEPTNCPECKCNCTDVCEKEPDELAACKGCIPLHVVIIVIAVLVFTVIILAARLIWRESKFSELRAKCDQVAEGLKIEIAKNARAKENGNYKAPNCVNASAGSNHRQGQNGNGRGDRVDGNVSQLPLLDESLNPANDSLHQNGKSPPQVVDLSPSGPQSLKSIEPVRPFAEVKPRVGHLPGLSSRGGLLLHADVHNGESSTINHPGRHENPGMEMSTLPSPAPLAKQEDTIDNTAEPEETDQFIQDQPSKSGNKTVKKDKGGIKGLISKFSPKSPVKKDPAVSVASSKDDKDMNRNPGSAHLSVTGGGDKGKPPKLYVHLPPSSSSPKSPEAPGSLTTPQTQTPAATDKPEVGASPTTEGPKSEKTEKGSSVTDTKQGVMPSGSESVLPGDRPSSSADGKAGGKRATNGSSPDHHKHYLDEVASDVDFEEVGENLTPDNLKALYRRLGVKAAAVEQAEVESGSTLFREKAIYVLRKWKHKEGKKATRRCLIEALRKGGQGLNADTLEDYFSKNAALHT